MVFLSISSKVDCNYSVFHTLTRTYSHPPVHPGPTWWIIPLLESRLESQQWDYYKADNANAKCYSNLHSFLSFIYSWHGSATFVHITNKKGGKCESDSRTEGSVSVCHFLITRHLCHRGIYSRLYPIS